MPREDTPVLSNLQALRALAALGVVLFHLGLMPATRLPFRVGAAGVDLFFVLSGFIIAHSAARGSRHFLLHRLIRVLPPYWIATLLAALLVLPALGAAPTMGWLGQSLLFFTRPDGRPPLIFVGWTLVYELGFYLLYWLALRFGPVRAPLACLPMLLALAAARWPLLAEFALGLGAYLLAERTGNRLPGRAGLLLAVVGVALLFAMSWFAGDAPADARGAWRVASWGMPAAAVVLGLVVAERGGIATRSRFVLLLGGASYALYLLHPIVLGPLVALPPLAPPASWIACTVAAAISAGLAIAFFRLVEMPLLRAMRRRLGDRSPLAPAPSSAPSHES